MDNLITREFAEDMCRLRARDAGRGIERAGLRRGFVYGAIFAALIFLIFS